MCQHINRKGTGGTTRVAFLRTAEDFTMTQGRKAPEHIYFSLKTESKVEAYKLAFSHTRRLDAMWKAHRDGQDDPKRALAQLEAAGLRPGNGAKNAALDPVTNSIDYCLGRAKPWEERPEPSHQTLITYDMLMTGNVPKTLGDAGDKHIEPGKLSKETKQIQQFERAWAILMEVTGDITLNNLTREHANQFVRKVISKGKGLKGNGPATVERYLLH